VVAAGPRPSYRRVPERLELGTGHSTVARTTLFVASPESCLTTMNASMIVLAILDSYPLMMSRSGSFARQSPNDLFRLLEQILAGRPGTPARSCRRVRSFPDLRASIAFTLKTWRRASCHATTPNERPGVHLAHQARDARMACRKNLMLELGRRAVHRRLVGRDVASVRAILDGPSRHLGSGAGVDAGAIAAGFSRRPASRAVRSPGWRACDSRLPSPQPATGADAGHVVLESRTPSA